MTDAQIISIRDHRPRDFWRGAARWGDVKEVLRAEAKAAKGEIMNMIADLRRLAMTTLTLTRILTLVFSATGVSATAQWLNFPTPGMPRTADGKPNLAAPAPRTMDGKPDFSGLWSLNAGPGHLANVAAGLKPEQVQPWAEALYRQRLGNLGNDDPWTVQCLPAGPRAILMGGNGPARIIQTPQILAILYDDLSYRQIFLDGRELPKDPDPSWMGFSVGHWEGDTLVVESTGFKDRSWLDMGGHPHTESLRTTERFRRTSFGRIELQVTYDDSKAYTKSWTVSFGANLAPDTEMLEYVCAENERDRSHLVGRTAEEKKVTVSREILSKYVGLYETVSTTGTAMAARTFNVTLSGDQLMIEIGNNGKIPLIPLSETTFSPRLLGTYSFVRDDQGRFTRLIAYSTEGDVEAVRR
jgi:hypothetical protein